MYILFETPCYDDSDAIYLYEAVGYVDTELAAMVWCEVNKECRTYKYCPNKKVSSCR